MLPLLEGVRILSVEQYGAGPFGTQFLADLASEEGRAAFGRLVAGADAAASNLRGDVPERLGLTHAALAAQNRRILCAHLSACGHEGARATWPGCDDLMEAFGGAIPAAPIHDVPQAMESPFLPARGMIETLRTEDGASVPLLAEAGVSAAEIAALRARGTI
jgi:crotonobetainyl-CoA:carnitine CoA-transferase CaiB-like acyl-CoA transferase